MNFSLAETPMRIKSINTQKVLGATTRSLRFSLIAESVLISTIAFMLSLIEVLLLKDSGLKDLVSAGLQPLEHPILLTITFCLSLLMGFLSWHISLLLCYIVCTSTGTKRLFWSFS